MKRTGFLAAFLCVLSLFSVATAGELFPFVVSYDAPENATNISSWLEAPAGKHGFVRVQDGRFVTDAGRIKFWGTNTCFAANFLTHEQADAMAARMARFGINCVRLHHMDSRDIWGGNKAKTQMTLDESQMDKLDYFIAALKKRGIYVNLNLHVSRTLDQRDGFPKVTKERSKYDKGNDNFYRPLIEANKKFAADMLNRVNKYTNIAYKDEPAIAMIEINNENSIVVCWSSRGGFDQMPDPFLADFRRQWNDWLRTKYKTDAALRKAWNNVNEPLGKEILKPLKVDGGRLAAGWSWQMDADADAPIASQNGILRLDVRKKGKSDWVPQLFAVNVAVRKEKPYTLTLEMKASRKETVRTGLRMNHEPWQGLGFDAALELDTDWKTFTFALMPSADDTNARVTLGGLTAGTVYEIRKISLRPGGKFGLDDSETLQAGTVPVVWKSNGSGFSQAALDDMSDFVIDVETKYWLEMYRYIKDDLKARQPISGTQLEYGSTRAQAALDYCDIHSYWNHPTFPRVAWDRNDWFLRNRALVNYMVPGGTLQRLATKRVADKPYTVSEYNHPAPNQYQAEGLPMIAAFGAFQDWDGIFPFAYAHSDTQAPQYVSSFFDTYNNPVQMAHMIACYALFCRETIPAAKQTVTVPLSDETEREIFKRLRSPVHFDLKAVGVDNKYSLTHRVAIDVTGKVAKVPALPPIPENQQVFTADNEKSPEKAALYVNQEKPDRGYFIAQSADAKLFTGFVDEGKAYPFGGGTLTFGKTNLGWGTVTATRLPGRPGGGQRFLVVATGEMRNTDMKLESLGEDKVTLGTRWGKAPVLCEGLEATVTIPEKALALKAWALDASGNRMREVPVKNDAKGIAFEMKPEYRTIWYEIEWNASR